MKGSESSAARARRDAQIVSFADAALADESVRRFRSEFRIPLRRFRYAMIPAVPSQRNEISSGKSYKLPLE